jgi:hypothetical protein
MQASKEDRARLATDAILVAPGEIAIDPVPHEASLLRVCVTHGRKAKTMPITVTPPLAIRGARPRPIFHRVRIFPVRSESALALEQ